MLALSSEIGIGEVVALVEKRHAERFCARVREAVAEVEIGDVADRLAVSHTGIDRQATYLRGDFDFIRRDVFDEGFDGC